MEAKYPKLAMEQADRAFPKNGDRRYGYKRGFIMGVIEGRREKEGHRLARYDEAIRLLRKLYDACETSIDGESEAEVWNFLAAEPKEGR